DFMFEIAVTDREGKTAGMLECVNELAIRSNGRRAGCDFDQIGMTDQGQADLEITEFVDHRLPNYNVVSVYNTRVRQPTFAVIIGRNKGVPVRDIGLLIGVTENARVLWQVDAKTEFDHCRFKRFQRSGEGQIGEYALFTIGSHQIVAQTVLLVTAFEITRRYHQEDFCHRLAAFIGIGDLLGHGTEMGIVIENQVKFVSRAVGRRNGQLVNLWSFRGGGFDSRRGYDLWLGQGWLGYRRGWCFCAACQ